MLDRFGDRKIVIGLVIVQLLICAPFLNSFPIDLDEPFSIFHAQQSLSEFIPELQKGNNSPLHFILLHFWIKLFGIGAVAVRSLSLVFSLLTLPLLFRLGKKILNKDMAIVVCVLFIFSTFIHYHSMEARMYALMILLSVLTIHDLYHILFENKKWFWRLALWNALLFYTHYLSAFLVLTEVMLIVMMFKELDRKKGLQLLIAGGIAAVLVLPGLLQLVERFGTVTGGDNWLAKPDFSALYGNILRFFNYTLTFCILLGLVVVFGIINRKGISLRFKEDVRNRKYWFIVLTFAIPYFGMFACSLLVTPVFLDRYLIFMVPFLFLGAGVAIKIAIQEFKQWYFYALFMLPFIASCYYIPNINREGDSVANYVHEVSSKGDEIVICPPFYDLTFVYHYSKEMFTDYNNLYSRMEKENIKTIYGYGDIDTVNYEHKLIFVDAHSRFLYPNNDILSKLDKHHTFLESKAFKGDLAVYIYQL